MKYLSSKIFSAIINFLLATIVYADDIIIDDAWVREGPPNVKVLAAYMTIKNPSNKERAILSITSPEFTKIELHHTIYKDGMASMQQMQQLTIPAKGEVKLKPGGSHLMLFIPSRQLKAGDNVDFTLKFANGSSTMITAAVKKHTGDRSHGDHGKHEMHKEQDKSSSHEHGHQNH